MSGWLKEQIHQAQESVIVADSDLYVCTFILWLKVCTQGVPGVEWKQWSPGPRKAVTNYLKLESNSELHAKSLVEKMIS